MIAGIGLRHVGNGKKFFELHAIELGVHMQSYSYVQFVLCRDCCGTCNGVLCANHVCPNTGFRSQVLQWLHCHKALGPQLALRFCPGIREIFFEKGKVRAGNRNFRLRFFNIAILLWVLSSSKFRHARHPWNFSALHGVSQATFAAHVRLPPLGVAMNGFSSRVVR